MIGPSLSFDGSAFLDGIGGPGKPDDFILTFLLTETVERWLCPIIFAK
jgi:hypothetical protein